MPITPDRDNTPAVTDLEIWTECADRLRIASEAEGDNRTRGIAALEFRDGKQWPDDLYNQRKIQQRPSLTINHTNTFCRRVVNNMRQQRPRIKVHPVGDGADVEKARVIGGIIRHIENLSTASVAYDTAGESAVNIGWGYIRFVADFVDEKSMDQEIKILPVRNTFTVYMDPAAMMPSGSDADWVIITEKMKRSEYRRQYPKAANVEWNGNSGVGDNQKQWESKTEIRLAEYYRITRKNEVLHELSNGGTLFEEDYEKAKLALATQTPPITSVGSRQSHRRAVEWFKINGREVIERRALGEDDPNGPLPGPWIPVVRCEGNVLDLNGRVQRKGMVEDLMDPARMFNYWRTAETEQLALASKAPWIGPQGFRDGHPEWNNANQVPYSALEYNIVTIEQPDGSKTPLPPPQRQAAVEVPAGFVQAAQSAQQDLSAVAGMPHEPGQDAPGVVVSGKALDRRAALSDIGHFQYYDNQTQMIAHGGRILLSWIPTYYSTQRMQRIIGEDGVPAMTAINTPQPSADDSAVMEVKNDLSVGRYDVVMDTGPGFDTKRQEGSESMIELMRIAPLAEIVAKQGADLVFRAIDAPYMEELADRVMPQSPDGLKKVMEQLPKQAQGIVKTFVAQLNAANQKITQLEADLKYGLTKSLHQDATKLQIEDMKDKRAEKDTETDSQTKLFDTRSKVHGAIHVAEIRAGADIIGKHQDAGYEAVARREMEAAATHAASNST